MMRFGALAFVAAALFIGTAWTDPRIEDLHLQRLWVIDSENTLIGTVDDIVVCSDRTYVLDAWLGHILVLSGDGKPQATFGRIGEGPGEYRDPSQLVLLANDRLGVVDRMPPKLAILGLDGSPIDDLRLGPSTESIWSAQSAGDAIVIRSMQRSFNAEQRHAIHRLRRCAIDTFKAVTYVEETMPIPLRGEMIVPETLPAARWTLGRNGRVYVSSDYEKYRIRVFASDGSELNPISRTYNHLEYSKDEQEEREEGRRDVARRIGFYAAPSKYYRDIYAMHSRMDGSLWVQPSVGRPDPALGIFGTFDVYDNGQNLARRVRVFAPFDSEEDLYFISSKYLFVVENGVAARRARYRSSTSDDVPDAASQDLEALRVVCYALPLQLRSKQDAQ